MRKYTQEEFNNFEIVNGYKICPTGDYTNIRSFGEFCSFGESCSFENNTGKGNQILQIRAGSEHRTSTAFNLDTGIFVRSGCFFGTLDDFKAQVEKTHGDNIHAKTYNLWVEIIRLNFN